MHRVTRFDGRWMFAAMVAVTACGDGGARPTPGVSGDTITVGAILPLSDAVAVIGTPMAAGLQVYFDALNARGGIGGRYHVRLLAEDQTYANPSTSAQKFQKVKGDVALFAAVVGTDHINTLLPLLAEDSVMVVPATFDSEWVRERMLLPWMAPYQVWAMNGVGYFIEQGGGAVQNVCTMTLATGYGDAGVEGVSFAAEQMGFTVAAAVRFKQDDQDFVAPITQLRNARCTVVMLASLPAVTGRILGAAAQAGFAPQWIALSPGWHATMVGSPLRDYLVKHFWVVFDGPAWGDTSAARMTEMMDAMGRHRPEQKPDLYFAAGYTMALGVEALLTRAVEMGDLSRAGILRASETLGQVSFAGLAGDYRYGPAADREPPRTTTIFRVDPEAPIGLRALRSAYVTPAASAFAFEERARP